MAAEIREKANAVKDTIVDTANDVSDAVKVGVKGLKAGWAAAKKVITEGKEEK